jgi:hypothetical protein
MDVLAGTPYRCAVCMLAERQAELDPGNLAMQDPPPFFPYGRALAFGIAVSECGYLSMLCGRVRPRPPDSLNIVLLDNNSAHTAQ